MQQAQLSKSCNLHSIIWDYQASKYQMEIFCLVIYLLNLQLFQVKHSILVVQDTPMASIQILLLLLGFKNSEVWQQALIGK
jgi:hypothetical protein